MNQENTQPNTADQSKDKKKSPNDCGSILVEGFVKIFDPKDKEVFVEKRA